MKIRWYNNQYIFRILSPMLLFSCFVLVSDLLNGNPLYVQNALHAKAIVANNPVLLTDTDSLVAKTGVETVIPVLYGQKNKAEITGAVSFIQGKKVENIPGTNCFNTLTGLVPGLLVIQGNGLPGEDAASLYIRGQRTFGPSNKTPLVLLDGVETDITQISPYDIESITVLKDAVSTAMYGLRSTNGIILVTSKRGREGSIRINVNTQTSLIKPNKLPEFLGASDYAALYNEAALNEGLLPKYTQTDIDAYKNGTDRLRYPNNNWTAEYMKDYSVQTRQTLDISGGNKNARYFFSSGYLHNNGLFVTDNDLNTYNTNSSLDLTDIHTNLDFKVNDRLSVNVDLKTKFDRRNNPGEYASDYESVLTNNMMSTPSLAYPTLNEDGSLAGNANFRNNIYGLLNKSGYSIWTRTFLFGNFDIDYKLDFITKGLILKARYGFSNYVDHVTDRSKNFAVYEFLNDTTYNKIGVDTEMQSASQWSNNNRYLSGEAGLEYSNSFGKSSVNGLLLFDRQEYVRRASKLPHIYQGIKGSFSYGYDSKYILDVAFAYQGSEQFPKGSRYGLFPAVGIGWVLSNEKFMAGAGHINYLKLRASGGSTGNDFNPYANNTPYFAFVENYQEGNGYSFGTTPTGDGGFYEAGIANNAITWEKSLKYNIGADAVAFDNKLSLTVDYFYEENKDILVEGANPGIFGADFWYPVGIVQNQGVDGIVSWTRKIGDFFYYVSANATFVRNKIIEQKEQKREYDWMVRTGNPIDARFVYVFDRFFTEEDDFLSLPDQSQLGTVHPGDLKYKDLNNDNIINDKDQMNIGKPALPEIFYGINAGLSFKGVDFNILFQGVGEAEKMFSGNIVYEFVGGKGNVTKEHLGRWTTGSGQNATYPRLAIQQYSNNRRGTDFWLKDSGYLRLKTIELGYTLNKPVVEKLHLTKLRVYVNAYNLFTWSKIDFADPESSAEGTAYPIPRIISAGLNIGF